MSPLSGSWDDTPLQSKQQAGRGRRTSRLKLAWAINQVLDQMGLHSEVHTNKKPPRVSGWLKRRDGNLPQASNPNTHGSLQLPPSVTGPSPPFLAKDTTFTPFSIEFQHGHNHDRL